MIMGFYKLDKQIVGLQYLYDFVAVEVADFLGGFFTKKHDIRLWKFWMGREMG